MRIGILGLLHESNTFVAQPTLLERFHEDLWLCGEAVIDRMSGSHHELGGFIDGIHQSTGNAARCVGLFAARATPSGPIEAAAFDQLMRQIESAIADHLPLDGLLVAAHGAAVSQVHPDADGHWLGQVRQQVGSGVPIIATLDPHANLSPAMVAACDALIAYRTNPHLDQRRQGELAAQLLLATLAGKVRPAMAASFLPLAINIERQGTDDTPLRELLEAADRQLELPAVLSNSLLLGFPYADVPEMGAAVLTVTDADPPLAQRLADQLAERLWSVRQQLEGSLLGVEAALDLCQLHADERICLLDMGDNVGGGSAADGTLLAAALHRRRLGPAFVSLFDPAAVECCRRAGRGTRIALSVGGHTDDRHGPPLELSVTVQSLVEGRFRELQPRHGGITEFDQGATAMVEADDSPLTIMLTSKRMVPFSLQQLIGCGVDPDRFRILVAKGVHAPVAAYREVCHRFVRVNTPGATCADLHQLDYQHRRRPMFPFDR
jgi:microcystin degradation protein MlrC